MNIMKCIEDYIEGPIQEIINLRFIWEILKWLKRTQ